MTSGSTAPEETQTPTQGNDGVSIVIVNYNGAGLLGPCLESVFSQQYRPLDVVVVDNASTDGSRELLERRFPEARVLFNKENRGFAEATNQGVAYATNDRIVLLNNDTIVDRNWLSGLLKAAYEPGVAVVTSKVVTEGIPGAFYEMNGTLNYLGYNIMRVFQDLSMVFFAGGASLTFSKQMVGLPFLPEYFLYHEDVFLSWRMRLRGFDVRMAQDSLVHHVGSATTKRQPSALVTFYQERNRLLNALLLYEGGTLLRLIPFFVVDAAAKIGVALVGRGKSLAGLGRAYGWIITHPAWIRLMRKRLQGERSSGDRDILRLMSSRLLEGEGRTAALVNALASGYAKIVGLPSHD
jgi:GT2 family glycosyltransferase